MMTEKCSICEHISRGIDPLYLADQVEIHMEYQHGPDGPEYWGGTDSPDAEAFPD